MHWLMCYSHQYRLMERLRLYDEKTEQELKQRGFPEDILLCHVVGVWQHVVRYDQDLQSKTNK